MMSTAKRSRLRSSTSPDWRSCNWGAADSTKTLTAGSGQATVSIANQDLFWHTFTIDKLGVNVLVPVGGHRELSLNLAPGTYIYYCAIPGHRQAGMQGTLTVR